MNLNIFDPSGQIQSGLKEQHVKMLLEAEGPTGSVWLFPLENLLKQSTLPVW